MHILGWDSTVLVVTFLDPDLAVRTEPPADGQSLLKDRAEPQTPALCIDGLQSTQSQVDLGCHLDMQRREG